MATRRTGVACSSWPGEAPRTPSLGPQFEFFLDRPVFNSNLHALQLTNETDALKGKGHAAEGRLGRSGAVG
jgi:hypothetical protein